MINMVKAGLQSPTQAISTPNEKSNGRVLESIRRVSSRND